jgi:long-subunit fatty acid transport protein
MQRITFVVLLMALSIPGTAYAGGMQLPANGARAVGRGGAVAVNAGDLTALHYNPGALGLLSGSHFLFNHNTIAFDNTFQRATLQEGWGDQGGHGFPLASEETGLFAKGVFLALASDFGLDEWMFAMGAYGPPGIGSQSFEDYGPQAFMLSSVDATLAYYSLAMAWSPSPDFGLGVTLQYADLIEMKYSLVIDATKAHGFQPGLIQPIPNPDGLHLLTTLNMADHFGFSAIVGAFWRPDESIELGISGRVIPTSLEPTGSVSVDEPSLADDVHATQELTLPIQLRGGVRYVHRSNGRTLFDLELDLFWENWSTLDAFDIDLSGRINGQTVTGVSLPRQWNDVFSVRLGSDIHLMDGGPILRLGSFIENGATPHAYSHLDFPSFDRLGTSVGLEHTFGAITLQVSYMHIFQESRTVTEEEGKVFLQRPLANCPEACDGYSGVVANAGTFQSSFDTLSVGMSIQFSDWF